MIINQMWATQRQIKAARKGRAGRAGRAGCLLLWHENHSQNKSLHFMPHTWRHHHCLPAALFAKWRTIGGRKFNFAFLLSIDEIAPCLLGVAVFDRCRHLSRDK